MTVQRKRSRLPDIAHTIQSYLFNRDEAKGFVAAKEKAGGQIRDYIRENGAVEKDAAGHEVSGNIVYLLPEPVQIGSKDYAGMELRKKTDVTFDEDAALALAVDKGLMGIVTHTEVVVDQEAFYILQQQGRLTEAELDELLVEGEPTYSLWAVEAR
jgi:hypothetical protein